MTEAHLPPVQSQESVLAPDVRQLARGIGSYEDLERLRATAQQITWSGEDGGRFDGPDGVPIDTTEAQSVLNTADHPQRLILGERQTDQLLDVSHRLGGHNTREGLGADEQQALATVSDMAKSWGVARPEDLTPDELAAAAARRVSLSERVRAEQPRGPALPELEPDQDAGNTPLSVGSSAVNALTQETVELPPVKGPATPEVGASDTTAQEAEPAEVETGAEPEADGDLTAILDALTGEDEADAPVDPEEPSFLESIAESAEIDTDAIVRSQRRESRRAARAAFRQRRWEDLRNLVIGLKNLPADILNSPEGLMSVAAGRVILRDTGQKAVRAGQAGARAARWTAQTYRNREAIRDNAKEQTVAATAGAFALYLQWVREQQPRK